MFKLNPCHRCIPCNERVMTVSTKVAPLPDVQIIGISSNTHSSEKNQTSYCCYNIKMQAM